MAQINFFALGGQDEEGKNCYILEVDKDIFIINSGVKFPVNNSYGIDNVIPDFEYLKKHEKNIKGLFITDTKNQSFSSLPWLLMNIKNINIYTTPFNKYVVLERLSKYKIEHEQFNVIPLSGSIKLGGVEVVSFPIASSLPFSSGFNFKTEDGDIIFLTNCVIGTIGKNKIYGSTNLEKIKANISPKGLIALILDSGFSNYPGKTIDKMDLKYILKPVFDHAQDDQRIIVGGYDEEMASIEQILDLAIEYKRPVSLYGRTYNYLFNLLIRAFPEIEHPQLIDYTDLEDPNKKEETKNAIVLVTSTRERLFQRFIRFTENKDVYFKLRPSDHVIMLAPPINGLEVYAAFTLDEIARITRNITNIEFHQYYQYRPAKDDIYDIVKFLQPKNFIPIQGLYRYLVNASFEANRAGVNNNNCLVLQNGKIVSFEKGQLEVRSNKIHKVGEVLVDGFGVGDISKEVIHEREILARDGVISIATSIDASNKQFGKVVIEYAGLVSKDEKNEIDELITNIVIDSINNIEFFDSIEVQNLIRKSVRKKVYKKAQKEPLVIVSLFNVTKRNIKENTI